MGLAHRILRLAAFGAFVAATLYLVANFGLAWMYVSALTHPACDQKPDTLANLPGPHEFTLESQDGVALRAWYYPSRNGAAILALGGPGGSLGNNLPPVGFLIDAGYGVLQIDSRACTRTWGQVTLGAKESLDAEAGLEFLLKQPEVNKIGALGFSMGGANAIRTAARRQEIAAVVAEGGYFNLGKDFVDADRSGSLPLKAMLYSVAGIFWLQTGLNPWLISPVDDLAKISPRPVLLVYGEFEAADGRAEMQFESAKEPKELWIVPGGSHGGNYRAANEEYERRVLDFFNQALLNPRDVKKEIPYTPRLKSYMLMLY